MTPFEKAGGQSSRRGRVVLTGLVALAALYTGLAWRARPVPAHPFFEGLPTPFVIAHQGGNHLRPDNTMMAFEHAVALGVDVLEMDVSRTSDGVFVVMHDLTVDRTTDGAGTIADLASSQIMRLDAAYNWSRDDGATFPYRGQGVTVPRLANVLAAFPNQRFNIEIKPPDPDVAVAFCAFLRDQGRARDVLVASFHALVMDAFRDACPEVATSAVEDEIRLFYGLNLAFLGALYPAPAQAFQVPEYSGGLHVVTGSFVRGAHAHAVDVHVWTVNDRDQMKRLVSLGVDAIITDRPDLLLEVLGR